MNAYVLYAVNTAGGLFDGITDQKIGFNIEEAIKKSDGGVDPTFTAVLQGKPVLGFTTLKVANSLSLCGIGGMTIGTSADFFLQKVADGGTRAGSGSHIRLRTAKGLIVPKMLRASQGREASIENELYATSSDGSTAPVAYAGSQSLTGSPTLDQMFTLGPVSINNSAWGGVQDLSVEFGIKVECKFGDGGVYPKLCYIAERKPKITLKGLDSSLLASLGVAGAAISATTSVTLLGVAPDGTRNGSDVVLTFAAGRAHISDIGGGDESEQENSVTITPRFDGTNDIVAITTP